MDWVATLARWLHYLFGVMWIGLLYYFNFVQTQALAQANAAADGSAAGISRYVAPRALEYFRWSALVTWIMGAILLFTLSSGTQNGFASAFALRPPYTGIGIGAWLGTIMLFNVWGLIYPNQMKILGKVPATDEQKARARRIAALASRTNTMLSIPMLFFMAFGFNHMKIAGF
ncbi:MAG: urate hydroxylase PuuD [Candidatus Eremiobacteraeota bacterium]|nr:urate hydroxylase PuuD [Candidatus Eremiobacteraeota bacterium]MBV9647549.1 urate hydroxylase PuuD [Candidatus Eremiobacteraeota bacterium]